MNVYDFDKTIVHGDSSVHFVAYCLLRRPAAWRPFLHALARLPVFLRGGITKTEWKQELCAFVRVLPDPEETVRHYWRRRGDCTQEWYKKKHAPDDVVISGSPEFLVAPYCASIGIKNVIASRIDVHTGVYTGANCTEEEKVRRFRERFGDARIDEFYSDSHSDDPMAACAEKAFLVKRERLYPWDARKG